MLAISVVLFCALDFASVTVLHESFQAEPETPWIMLGGFSCLAIASAAIVLLCVRGGDSALTRVLCWQPLRWLGQRSYGFYVFHMIWIQPTLVLAAKVLGRRVGESNPASVIVLQTIVAFFITLGVSAASYAWFERPFLKLKDRWTQRSKSASVLAASQ